MPVENGEDSLEGNKSFVHARRPDLILLRTRELPYWQGMDLYHSVVLVGYDDKHLYLNDPNFENVPLSVLVGDFELAWLEMNYRYAVLSK